MQTLVTAVKIYEMNSIKNLIEKMTQYHLLVVLVIFFQVVLNVVWHTVNNAPPTWDSAGHLGLSFLFAQKIPALLFGDISFGDFMRISDYYPPLVQLMGGLMILLLGRNYFNAIFIGTFFLALSILYFYKILIHYFKDEKLAVFTVFIYSMLPHVWEQSRQFHLDVPLVALLLMAYYYLIKSDSLKQRKNSLLFFFFFTLVQLTKWYGFVYLVVPFIYEVVSKSIRNKEFINRDRMVNVLQGVLIVLFIAVPWYVANYSNIVNIVSITSHGEVGDPENVLSFESIIHYLKLITSHQISFVSVVILFFSIYMFNKRRVPFRTQLFHLMLFPYVVFTLIQNKDLRYVLPLTPIFALYISYTLLRFDFKGVKVLRVGYPLYLMGLFFFMSFNQFKYLPTSLKPLTYLIGGPYYHGWYYEPYSYAANFNDWRGSEILNDINAMAKNQPLIVDRYRVLELSDNRYYSLASFEMYRRQNNFEKMEIVVPYFQFTPFTDEELGEYLQNVQFALVPKDPGPTGLRNYAVLIQLKEYFLTGQDPDFTLEKTYEMPDGNVLSLYKRENYLTYENPTVRADSLRISVGNILYIDRTDTGGLTFKVSLFDKAGEETVIDVIGGGSQRRISLENVERFRIDLPTDQQDVRDLRGWMFENGEFVLDPNFVNIVNESGNEYIYDNLKITPRSQYEGTLVDPKSIVRFDKDRNMVLISNEKPLEGQKVFVAYATTGWEWGNSWLMDNSNYIEIPVENLLQLEVSQKSQLIVGFPLDWGFFPCYEGRAVCFYPVVGDL